MTVIKVENLTKVFKKQLRRNFIKSFLFPKYENFTAVDNVSFEIEKGETFGLLGPNGAGKTTTIQMLCGLEHQTSGNIYINDLNINSEKNFRNISEKFNVLFSDKLLFNRLSAFDNLEFYGNLYSVEDPKERAEELLELVDLVSWRDQYVESFSLGMRMKLALARALVNNPEILYLDEPTLGLDVKNAEFVRDFLQNLNCTILLTTHYLNEAIRLCDRIGILQKGKLIHIGTPEYLKKKEANTRTFIINTNDNQAVKQILMKNSLIVKIVEKSSKLEIHTKNIENYFDILNEISQFKLSEIQESKTGLEGLFFDVHDESTESDNKNIDKTEPKSLGEMI